MTTDFKDGAIGEIGATAADQAIVGNRRFSPGYRSTTLIKIVVDLDGGRHVCNLRIFDICHRHCKGTRRAVSMIIRRSQSDLCRSYRELAPVWMTGTQINKVIAVICQLWIGPGSRCSANPEL